MNWPSRRDQLLLARATSNIPTTKMAVNTLLSITSFIRRIEGVTTMNNPDRSAIFANNSIKHSSSKCRNLIIGVAEETGQFPGLSRGHRWNEIYAAVVQKILTRQTYPSQNRG